MSSKSLSALNIPTKILEKLHHNSIFKIQVLKLKNNKIFAVLLLNKDLLAKSPMELVKILNISLQKVEIIFNTCFENIMYNHITVILQNYI